MLIIFKKAFWFPPLLIFIPKTYEVYCDQLNPQAERDAIKKSWNLMCEYSVNFPYLSSFSLSLSFFFLFVLSLSPKLFRIFSYFIFGKYSLTWFWSPSFYLVPSSEYATAGAADEELTVQARVRRAFS